MVGWERERVLARASEHAPQLLPDSTGSCQIFSDREGAPALGVIFMRYLFGSIVVAALLLTGPALAETDWSTYGDFSATRCEDGKTIADMTESAKGLKYDNGRPVFSFVSGLKVISSKTVRATRNTLICQVRISVVHDGSRHTYSGRHTVKLFSGGRWTTAFKADN